MVTSSASLDSSPRTNWVEKRGGLPPYVRKIARALMKKKGYSKSHAIAVAINAMKRWSSTGSVTARGHGQVTAKTRAKAEAAAGRWTAMKSMTEDEVATIDLVAEAERRGLVVDLAGRWRHGWIPLDAAAALSKAKGNRAAAAKIKIGGGGSRKLKAARAEAARRGLTGGQKGGKIGGMSTGETHPGQDAAGRKYTAKKVADPKGRFRDSAGNRYDLQRSSREQASMDQATGKAPKGKSLADLQKEGDVRRAKEEADRRARGIRIPAGTEVSTFQGKWKGSKNDRTKYFDTEAEALEYVGATKGKTPMPKKGSAPVPGEDKDIAAARARGDMKEVKRLQAFDRRMKAKGQPVGKKQSLADLQAKPGSAGARNPVPTTGRSSHGSVPVGGSPAPQDVVSRMSTQELAKAASDKGHPLRALAQKELDARKAKVAGSPKGARRTARG